MRLASLALFAMALVIFVLPAHAGGGIGQLAPLGGLAYQPYQPYGQQPPPRIETVIPDGLGGYHVFAPNRPTTTVVPDGFGGYHIYNGR